jgi:hypothetical protein
MREIGRERKGVLAFVPDRTRFTKNKLGECCSVASKIERSTGSIPDPP